MESRTIWRIVTRHLRSAAAVVLMLCVVLASAVATAFVKQADEVQSVRQAEAASTTIPSGALGPTTAPLRTPEYRPLPPESSSTTTSTTVRRAAPAPAPSTLVPVPTVPPSSSSTTSTTARSTTTSGLPWAPLPYLGTTPPLPTVPDPTIPPDPPVTVTEPPTTTTEPPTTTTTAAPEPGPGDLCPGLGSILAISNGRILVCVDGPDGRLVWALQLPLTPPPPPSPGDDGRS